MNNEYYRAETPIHFVDRIALSREMSDEETRDFLMTLEHGGAEYKLSERILQSDPDLVPKNILFLDGKTWFLPEKIVRARYKSPSSDERGSNYLQFACYVKDGDDIYPRTFYKSNSDGNWRAGIVRYNDGYGFSKGDDVVQNYTQTNKPCPELMIYLEGISTEYDPENKEFKDNLVSKRNWGFLEHEFQVGGYFYERVGYKDVNTFGKEVLGEFDDGNKLKNLKKYIPGYFNQDGVSLYGGIEKLKSELPLIDYPDGFVPDFHNSPRRVVEYYHSLLGVIRVETYRATLNNESIEWNVAYDKAGRIWIDSIVEGNGGNITTYGTQKRIIQAGILNSKPLDYENQLDGLPEIERGKVETDTFGTLNFSSNYRDFTPVLDTLKPIQEFRKARGMQSTALSRSAGQGVTWPDVEKIRNYFRIGGSSGKAAVWERRDRISHVNKLSSQDEENTKTEMKQEGLSDTAEWRSGGFLLLPDSPEAEKVAKDLIGILVDEWILFWQTAKKEVRKESGNDISFYEANKLWERVCLPELKKQIMEFLQENVPQITAQNAQKIFEEILKRIRIYDLSD